MMLIHESRCQASYTCTTEPVRNEDMYCLRQRYFRERKEDQKKLGRDAPGVPTRQKKDMCPMDEKSARSVLEVIHFGRRRWSD